MTAAEEGLPGADKLDAWTTPAHFHIDIDPQQRRPYITIGAPYIASKPGRVGATMDTAQVFDDPHMYDDTYPDTIVRVVLDMEINAFCASGPGSGQFLGRAVWQWERSKGASLPVGRVSLQPQGSLAQPTQDFVNAVIDTWATQTKFNFPRVTPPKKGGTSCP